MNGSSMETSAFGVMPTIKQEPDTSPSPSNIKTEPSDAPLSSFSTTSSGGSGGRLYHTLTACTRCRSRKTRCDAGLPRCGPCERSSSHCEFFDSTKGKTIPRNYVLVLQDKVRRLEAELARQQALLPPGIKEQPDENDLVRRIGMVSLDKQQKMEPRFVGSSSGINMTRIVLDYTKKKLEPEAINEIAEEHRAHTSMYREEDEFDWNNMRAANGFPGRDIVEKLVEIYMQKAQLLLPILHEPTFRQTVEDIFNGDTDPFKTFQLRMVLAVALQRIGRDAAEEYYLAAYEQLEQILEPMDMMTLQCLALLCQYSILTPTRTSVYHVLGIAVRLCIQLGFSQEKTIMLSDTPLDAITMDLRRRLFWVFASFEYGVSHVLGRPSGFSTIDAYIDVEFYSAVDDKDITYEGIRPDAEPSPKKLISMHFFRLRRLQAQIRQTMYQNPRPTPVDDRDPWFQEMNKKIDTWLAEAPNQLGILTNDWFMHRYHNMIIFMYRPSPQIPKPSIEATKRCYEVAVKNVYLQSKMHAMSIVDITFVFVYQVTISLMAIIWAICAEEIREVHPMDEVRRHINTSLGVLRQCEKKWPGTRAAVDIFEKLSKAALKLYVKDEHDRSDKSMSLSPPPNPADSGASYQTQQQQLLKKPLQPIHNGQRSVESGKAAPARPIPRSSHSPTAFPAEHHHPHTRTTSTEEQRRSYHEAQQQQAYYASTTSSPSTTTTSHTFSTAPSSHFGASPPLHSPYLDHPPQSFHHAPSQFRPHHALQSQATSPTSPSAFQPQMLFDPASLHNISSLLGFSSPDIFTWNPDPESFYPSTHHLPSHHPDPGTPVEDPLVRSFHEAMGEMQGGGMVDGMNDLRKEELVRILEQERRVQMMMQEQQRQQQRQQHQQRQIQQERQALFVSQGGMQGGAFRGQYLG